MIELKGKELKERREKEDILLKNLDNLKLLNDFMDEEFGESLKACDIDDIKRVPIMWTEYYAEDEEELDEDISIQVYVNFKDMTLFIEYNNVKVYEYKYETEEEFKDLFESLDFESYCNLDDLDEYKKIKGVE